MATLNKTKKNGSVPSKSVAELIDERVAEMFGRRPNNRVTRGGPNGNRILVPKVILHEVNAELFPQFGASRSMGDQLKYKAPYPPGKPILLETVLDVGGRMRIFEPANRMVRIKLTNAADPNLHAWGKRKRTPKAVASSR